MIHIFPLSKKVTCWEIRVFIIQWVQYSFHKDFINIRLLSVQFFFWFLYIFVLWFNLISARFFSFRFRQFFYQSHLSGVDNRHNVLLRGHEKHCEYVYLYTVFNKENDYNIFFSTNGILNSILTFFLSAP